MFSENQAASRSSSYGSIGYDFSFSNSRLSLQVAKRKKGRLTRETIGSAVIQELVRLKSARFRIYGNRKTKQFGVWVNDRKMASWKDGDEEFIPIGNTVSFYNQGGSSFLRLNETSISGWEGDYTPVEEPSEEEKATTRVTFANGDSTASEIGALVDGNLQLKTKRGTFKTPVERIRSIYFPQKDGSTTKPASERVWLTGSSGNLALNLTAIRNGMARGETANFGLVEISVSRVRRLACNIHLLELEKYLVQLRLARQALDARNLETANQILQKTNPAMRGWLWGRLAFHAKALSSSEILSFAPHPESGLAGADFAEDSETILTVGKDATFGLWNGHARLASGKIKGSESLHGELGRFPNETQRFTTISRDFWLGKFEVTQEQYEKLVGENPSTRKSPRFSVEKTSWFDATEYCKLLNKKFPPSNGYVYRLPTEAEWEYACRAGATGPFTGSSITSIPHDDTAYSEHLSKVAWFSENSNNAPHAGGEKDANAFGLHDMHGNLWEWCLDHVELNKQNMLKSRIPGAVDPFITEGRWRSLRGGSFNVGFNRCRSAYRGANDPGVKRDDRGFRVARAPDLSPDANVTKVLVEKPHVVQELGLSLMPIPAGSFLIGSPEKLPGACAVSVPKTDLILTGNAKGELYLSDLAGRSPRNIGQKLPAAVTAMAASPDGKLTFTGCSDGSTHLVALADGKKIASFSDHKSPVTTVAFSPKKNLVASSELAGKAVIRTLEDQRKPIFLEGNSARFDNIDFSPDGTRVLTSGPGAPPALWDCADGAFLHNLKVELEDVVAARFARDGQGVSVACRSGRILFCETSTGIAYNKITLPGRELADLQYSPEGNRMLVVTQEGLCSIRSVPQAEAIRIVEKDGSLTSSPDYYFDISKHNASTSSLPSTLEDFLLKHGQKMDGITLPPSCSKSPDNAWILTTTDGALRLWRAETGKLEANLADKLSAPFEACTFSPDGLFATGRLATGQILAYPAFPQSDSTNSDLLPNADIIRSWFNSPPPR
jgi:formylglycine-generating enzyme required for sulfatase activity/WD40 repeat protein